MKKHLNNNTGSKLKGFLQKTLFIGFLLFTLGNPTVKAQGMRNIGQTALMQNFAPQRAAAGAFHNLEIVNGNLWGFGFNDYGQLGDGTQTTTNVAVQIGTDNDWVAIDCGFYHSVGIKANGTMWGTGYNVYGQLGDGSNYDRHGFVQAGKDSNWVAVSCGLYHTLAIKSNGTLWAFGFNSAGELGDNSFTHQYKPVQIGTDSNWIAVRGGRTFSMGLKSDGSIWTWGSNAYGQLGDAGTSTKRGVPYHVGNYVAKAIAAGSYHALALLDNGKVISWGLNDNGQLGDGSRIDRNVPVNVKGTYNTIAAGNAHSFGIASDGYMWSWGLCSHGQLGHGNVITQDTPQICNTGNRWVAIDGGEYHSIATDCNGKLYTFGRNNHSQIGSGFSGALRTSVDVESSVLQWNQISGADGSFAAVRSDGTLWAWGNNNNGQLGDGTNATRSVPVMIGTDTNWVFVAMKKSSTIALKCDGTLWAWGNNADGQLGIGNKTNQKSPVQVGSSGLWISVNNGGSHMLGIQVDGSLWAWGKNNNGQLGDNSQTQSSIPVKVGSDKWRNVAAGDAHSVGVSSSGKLYAWGSGAVGQNAAGAFGTSKLVPYLVDNSGQWSTCDAGNNHTLALASSGHLYAFGGNDSGQLGNGNTSNQYSLTKVNTKNDVKLFGCGSHHNTMVTGSGKMRFWGTASFCEFANSKRSGVYNKPIADSSGYVVVLLAPGARNTAAVASSRNRICVAGDNHFGQIGNGQTSSAKTCAFDCSIILKPEISITSVNRTLFCTNDTLKIHINKVGTFDQSNTFSIQFSGINGTFGSPTNISPIKNLGDTVLLFLPAQKLPASNKYKIRLQSSIPLLSSPTWPNDLTLSPASAVLYSHTASFCEGQNIVLSAKSVPSASFTWKRNGLAVQNSTDTNFNVVDSGFYYLVCKGAFGCADSTPKQWFAKHPKPIAEIYTNDSTEFCAGDFAKINSKTNAMKTEFHWFLNANELNTDTLASLKGTKTGSYSLIERTAFGCSDTSLSIDLLKDARPIITYHSGNITSDTGKRAQFVVHTDSVYHYQWQIGFNGTFANIADGYHYQGTAADSLQIFHANDSLHYHHFRCIVTNNSGCSDTSAPDLLQVNAMHTISQKTTLIYPNPATEVLHIERINPGIHTLFLYDANGKLLMSHSFNDGNAILSIAHLSAGVYSIKIGNETQFFVKH